MHPSEEAAGRPEGANAVRFGTFEFLASTGELWKSGRRVRLQAQPARVLAALVARAGQVVSRDALQREVWGDSTHVDFERGLNFCIAQIRSALRDTAESPRFIETLPKQGYRFIAPLSAAPERLDDASADARRPRRFVDVATVGASLLVGLAVWLAWVGLPPSRPTVVVVPFYNETGRGELDVVARALGDATVASLAAPEHLHALSVIGNAPSLQSPFARVEVQRVARQLGAQWVVIGQLKADGEAMRLIGHLIRATDMKHVWAQAYDERQFTLDVQGRTAAAAATAISHAVATY